MSGVSGWKRSEVTIVREVPIGSMGLVYLPTFMVDFYGKCRQIYHTWMVWGWLINLFYGTYNHTYIGWFQAQDEKPSADGS